MSGNHARKQVRVGYGKAQRRGALLHARDVIAKAKDARLAVIPAIRLEALESRCWNSEIHGLPGADASGASGSIAGSCHAPSLN